MGYAIGLSRYIKEESEEPRKITFAQRGYLTHRCDPDIVWSRSDKPLSEQIAAIFRIMNIEEIEIIPEGTVLQ